MLKVFSAPSVLIASGSGKMSLTFLIRLRCRNLPRLFALALTLIPLFPVNYVKTILPRRCWFLLWTWSCALNARRELSRDTNRRRSSRGMKSIDSHHFAHRFFSFHFRDHISWYLENEKLIRVLLFLFISLLDLQVKAGLWVLRPNPQELLRSSNVQLALKNWPKRKDFLGMWWIDKIVEFDTFLVDVLSVVYPLRILMRSTSNSDEL